MADSQDKQDGNDGFTGYRYLVDAANTRQYALRFDAGQPKPPFDIYAVMPRENGFRANETVFAFDDEKKITAKGDRLVAELTAYQVNIGDTGNPRKLFVASVEYDIAAEVDNAPQITLTLTEASRTQLAAEGFSADFPAAFTYQIDPENFRHKQGGGAELRPGVLESLPVPPHQEGGAFLARISMQQKVAQAIAREVKQDAAAKNTDVRDYAAPDAQTLVEKKTLGDGDTLKIVFNFESRRVTESVFNDKGVALASHKFADYDLDALDTAFAQLKKMGGTPRPLNDGKKPGLPRPDNP
ncbi:MAG: hypothetical protein PSY14_10755 [bacterium]|nr:hypothetical protein [bacterium]